MGIPSYHRLSGGFFPEAEVGRWYEYIRYGKCIRSPYVEKDLWFINIQPGMGDPNYIPSINNSQYEWYMPRDEYTFLVNSRYANIPAINTFRRDVNRWSEVAVQKPVLGEWCFYYEMLWVDTPVFNYTLKDGTRIKYGYCRSQPHDLTVPPPKPKTLQNRSGYIPAVTTNYPNLPIEPEIPRELCYIAFENSSTFVVDKICINKNFIERLGKDLTKWMIICWCRLESEVKWDELSTGTLGGGYVRNREFALDSPYKPYAINEIETRITKLENLIADNERRKIIKKWSELSKWDKEKYMSYWEEDIFGKKLP